jgi:hypothetical protein
MPLVRFLDVKLTTAITPPLFSIRCPCYIRLASMVLLLVVALYRGCS